MKQIAKMIANTIEFSKSLPKNYKKHETYCKKCNELIGTPFIARVKYIKECKSKITNKTRKELLEFIQSNLCYDCYIKEVK